MDLSGPQISMKFGISEARYVALWRQNGVNGYPSSRFNPFMNNSQRRVAHSTRPTPSNMYWLHKDGLDNEIRPSVWKSISTRFSHTYTATTEVYTGMSREFPFLRFTAQRTLQRSTFYSEIKCRIWRNARQRTPVWNICGANRRTYKGAHETWKSMVSHREARGESRCRFALLLADHPFAFKTP